MKKLIPILFLIAATISANAFDYRAVEVNASNNIVVRPPNFWDAASNDVNRIVLHPENGTSNGIYNTIILLGSKIGATLDGFSMSPAVSTLTTNSYWWDFGITNTLGQPLIYATLSATNTVNFIGPTNGHVWSLLSFAVKANGADRNLLFPSNIPLLNTNGMTLTNGCYLLTLSNATVFRMTVQSNEFGLEPQWTVKP